MNLHSDRQPTRVDRLSHVDPRERNFLEQMRRCYHTGGIVRHFSLELRITKSLFELRRRFLDSIINECTALANTSMQLGRDESGLLLHGLCV